MGSVLCMARMPCYIGPPRGARADSPAPTVASSAPGVGAGTGRSTAPDDVAGVPVADPRLAEVPAVIADEWEESDERGRAALLARFRGPHPDLRERALARQGRRLARLAGGLGAG